MINIIRVPVTIVLKFIYLKKSTNLTNIKGIHQFTYRLYSKICLTVFHFKLWKHFPPKIKFQIVVRLPGKFTIYLQYEGLLKPLLLPNNSLIFRFYSIATSYPFLNPWKLFMVGNR